MEPEEIGVLRLFRFRPVRIAFDSILRLEMVPDLLSRDGVRDVYVGRQGPDELGTRVVASVWASRDTMSRTVGETLDAPVFYSEYLKETAERELTWMPLVFGFRFERPEPPGILRLVDGTVPSGELDGYVEEARDGTLADAADGRGPLALYLARRGNDAFTTLSVWPDWATLEAATGGSIQRPIATRHAERLTSWSASHFEVLPNLPESGPS